MKILIAEDSKLGRIMVCEALENLGHEVVVTEDGAEAWEYLQRGDGDISMVISDWVMPRMEGVELCRRIRESEAESDRYTYFILVTTRADRASYLEGMRAGADDFVTKPLDEEELHVRVAAGERVIDLRNRLVQLEGILPICSYCHKIRDLGDLWHQMEMYLEAHSGARFSHSICPQCAEAQAARAKAALIAPSDGS